MFHTKKQKGLSLITLVITIVVIIILAFITFRLNGNPLDEASAVKFKQEITDVKRGVETVKLINAKQGLDEKTLNKNFKKVEVTNPPGNFVSFDDDKLTAYLVDLEEIDYKKLQTGQGYKEINEGATVEFDVDDVYVYDKAGTVYYLKGAYLDGDELFYTAEEKKLDGPKVVGENTEGGKIEIRVTPTNSGEIISVKVGDIEATKISDEVYEFEVDKNGSYIITATEKGSGTTKQKVNVTKIDEGTTIGATTAPTIAEVMINSGEIYTNEENAKLTIKSDAELMFLKQVTDGSIPIIPSSSTSGWRNKADSTSIVLREGVNEVWVWFKNKGNNAILSARASIMLDTNPPTRTKPTVEIFNEYSFRITANQKDAVSGLKKVEIGYKKVDDLEYTWVEVPDLANPTIEILDNTPNKNYSIISRAEDNSGLKSESLDYMTGTLKGVPGGVLIDYNPKEGFAARSTIVITYPEDANNSLYEKWYRLNEGEWQIASSMEVTITIEENAVIDAVVVRKTDKETIFGEITTAIVNNIDGTNPTIGFIDLNPMNAENGADFKGTVDLSDYETGVIEYAIIETEGTPTTWQTLNRPMKVATITFDANIGKTYYIWAKDEAGNTARSIEEVSAIDLLNPEMTVSIGETVFDYTGLEIKPEIKVTFKGFELTKGTDYDVVYTNNINAGTAKATVTGKGVYAGTMEFEYTILKVKPTITLENITYLYNAQIQEIEPAKVLGTMDGSIPSGRITYSYYKDGELSTTTNIDDGATKECGAPAAEGTYYVIAQIAEDINYLAATSNVAIMSIQPRPVKVLFDAAGGTETETERMVYFGKEYGTLPETQREGYTFAGWYLQNGTKVEATSKVGTMDEHTLTAKWDVHKYTIKYDGNGNTGGNTTSSTHVFDTAKTLTPNGYTKTGYTFVGWNTEANGSGTSYVDNASVLNLTSINNGVVTLYAQWGQNGYQIKYDGNGKTSGTMANSSHVYDVEKALTANAYARTGYTFNGWNSKADGTGTSYQDKETVKNLTANSNEVVTIYAQWVANKYTVKYDGNGSTAGSMSDTTHTYDIAQRLPVNTYEKTGYIFGGWNTKANGTGTSYQDNESVKNLTATSNGTVTLYAQWGEDNYTISYELYDGIVSGTNPTNYSITSDSITLINPTKTGYTFAGWTGSNGTTPMTTVTIPKGSTGNKNYTANWTPIEYTITYDLAGGAVSGTNPTKYTIESNPITLINPSKTGYTFKGWTGTDLTSATQTVTIPKGSIGNRTYTAIWEVIEYTITYNLDGGAISGNPTKYTIESDEIILINPLKTGYEFAGWTGTDLASATQTVTIPKGSIGNRTYTATWTLNGYTITYDLDGGTVNGTNPTAYNVTTGAITLINPSKTGYTFAGWTGTDLASATTTVTIPHGSTGNREYKATWNLNTYTITYELNDGTVSGTNPTTYTVESDPITLINPSKAGYTFGGWSGTDLTVTSTTVTIPKGSTGNRTYTATWGIDTYTITYDLAGGTISGTNPATYTTETSSFTLINPSKTGYTFLGWTGTGLTAVTKNVTISKGSTGNRTYTANWNVNQYTITFNSNGGSSVSAITQDYGTEIVAPANPTRTGYTFTNWSPSLPTTMPANNLTVVAQWNPRTYTVTYDANGGAIDGNATATRTVTYDSTYGAASGGMPTPELAEYLFVGWFTEKTGGIQITETTKVNITSNQNLYAQWEEDGKIVITYDANGGTFGTNNINTMKYEVQPVDIVKTSKTSNVSADGLTADTTTGYGDKQAVNDIITIPGAPYLTVEITYATESASYDWVCLYDGSVTPSESNYSSSISGRLGGNKNTQTFTIEGDTVQIFFRSDVSICNYYGYYAKVSYKGDLLTLSNGEYKEPTKSGNVFAGWSRDKNSKEPEFESKEYVSSEKVTLYAIWGEKVTYNANGGTVDGATTTTRVVVNGSIYDKARGGFPIPIREGFNFLGWYTATSGGAKINSGDTVTITENQTLYARWQQPSKIAIYSETDNSLTFLVPTTTVDVGDTYNNKLVTNIYTNFEDTTYTKAPQVPWYRVRSAIKNVVVKDTISPVSTAFWFCSFYGLESLDLVKLDESRLTNMSYMFAMCGNSTTLDLSALDTRNVTDMSYMFQVCSSLTSLDLSTFNVANVTNMHGMFDNCRALTSIDFSGWNTSKVTDMGTMFGVCQRMTTINISMFNTSSVTDMSSMFWNCTRLTSINFGSNFTTANVTTLRGMFRECTSLTSLSITTKFNTAKTTDMAMLFYDCMLLTSLDVSKFNTSNVTDMFGMFYWCRELPSLTVTNFVTNNVNDMGKMFYNCNALTSLNVSKFNTSNVTDMSYMFCYCTDLTSLSVSNFDTSKVETMFHMFERCQTITTLNISNFKTSNVTNMAGMFLYCTKLTKITINTTNFNTSNVTTLASMFEYCQSLTTIDVSKFNTSNVTDMTSVFELCLKVTTLNVSNWDTSNVTTMYWMFMNCATVTKLDVSKWNTSNVTDMNHLFADCKKLTSINVSNFDTRNVTDMSCMFYRLESMTSIDVSKLNTSNVTDISAMFCASAFTTLNLSTFDTRKVTDMGSMFESCENLRSINFTGWVTSNVTSMHMMFMDCYSLTSLSISNWDTSNVKEMAFMFYNCSSLTLNCRNWNVSKVTDHTCFNDYASGVTAPTWVS